MNKTSLFIIGAAFSTFAAQAADKAVAPDNSGINKRDRADQTLTPEDQSQSKSDVTLAANIRKAVLAKPGLSIAGQNIKIITQDGGVTLRGPVKNSVERASIEKTVRKTAGASTVDNQLEIK